VFFGQPKPMSHAVKHSSQSGPNRGSEPLIKVKGVVKKFGAFTAVDNVDLEIYQGELFSILGASGCGKTTLLRILAGFESPSSGTVFVDGTDITNLPPYERPVNMMFQSYALFPHMTVANNIAYGLKRDGVAKPEIWKRVDEILGMVELSELSKRKPHQLSGGQRQRVALARALVKQPKVLLLDEPLAALDKRLREQTQFELMRIQDQVGVTFVVVTHDQGEAMTLSDRIAVMDSGRFVQVGSPSRLYEFPKNRFIANFIGSVNMLAGQVVRTDGALCTIDISSYDSHFEVEYGEYLEKGAAIWLAVRPEKIRISKTTPATDTPNRVSGIVDDIAYTGNMSTYRIKVQAGDILEVTHPNQSRATGGQLVADWGDTVHLFWAPSDAVLFSE